MEYSTHAILIIKKKDKYAQYYDERWDSFLFPNCKIKDGNDYHKIIDYLEENENINVKKIIYKGEKIHEKFSVSNNKNKKYRHLFYEIDVEQLPGKYKFFSMEELKKDERIMKVNSDIVAFVDEFDK